MMDVSVSERSGVCIKTLKTIISILSNPDREEGPIHHKQVNDLLERLSLWIGNIGALNRPESSMSLESRLREAKDILTHILELLDDLNDVADELLQIVSGEREGETASPPDGDNDEETQIEETELLEEFGACITRLFRVSSLIRQAAPTDRFAKALSRNRYHFNDQCDIAHVGEKYPKLATEEFSWLRKRLGRAITHRRQYLSYIRDHREALDDPVVHEKIHEHTPLKQHTPTKHLLDDRFLLDSSSQPSTLYTKASTLEPRHITPKLLTVKEESDSESDTRSYTTVSRSTNGDLDSSTTDRIPKLSDMRKDPKDEFECPFCFRIKKFKHEKSWRLHIFSDLRPYVCTFPDCGALYFGDINDWFLHEMQTHRVSYTCQICKHKPFEHRAKYLSHIRTQHPSMMDVGEEEHFIDLSRRPVDEIPAQECPCCLDWTDRLKRESNASIPLEDSNHVICVIPTTFKRHLASHLEQLALFAISIDSATEDDLQSDVASDRNLSVFAGPSDQQQQALFPAKTMGSPESKRDLCLLSLDGGGVRSLSSLLILKELMQRIDRENPPKPCEYFDMIGGTSSGGLIALLLGRLRLTVEECIEEYKKLCPVIFTQKHKSPLDTKLKFQGRFDTAGFEKCIQDLIERVGPTRNKDELLKENVRNATCTESKVFIVATGNTHAKPVVFSNYYSERRGRNMRNVVKIWEAARATMAAPTFFEPITIKGQSFGDGGYCANNPIDLLWWEATDIFRDPNDPNWNLSDSLQCVVSIGTGKLLQKEITTAPADLVEALKNILTDTEAKQEEFERRNYMLFHGANKRAFRFNVISGLEEVGLEEVKEMDKIEAVADNYIRSQATIASLRACSNILKQRACMEDFT